MRWRKAFLLNNYDFSFCFRKLLSLKEGTLDPNSIISKFLQLVRSGPFFKLLRVFTDLDLALLDGDGDDDGAAFSSKPTCIVDTRQWKHGCFTILEDSQFEGEACLDCIFNVGCEGLSFVWFFYHRKVQIWRNWSEKPSSWVFLCNFLCQFFVNFFTNRNWKWRHRIRSIIINNLEFIFFISLV